MRSYGCFSQTTFAQPPPVKPPTTRVDNFRETIHGTELIDPYRWLENHESPETRKGHTRDEYSISGDYWSGSFGQSEEFNFDWFISHEANKAT
ncbi:MAG TPA: hypothetical protein VJ656_00020 [Pyrinomonadaceae bacterium]|nr:hypothetical protein [Pyrinomonadaceae bacterium]